MLEGMNEVSPREAQQRIQKGALLIDVREPNEYQEVHASGATLMPLSGFAGSYNTLPTDAEIILICRSGARSEQAGQMLLESGYSNVTNLTGGTIAWVQGGLPTGDEQ
jgi:rhodanese-related sulfurtransferase